VSCVDPGINPRSMVFAAIIKLDSTVLFSLMMGGMEWDLQFDGQRCRQPVFLENQITAETAPIMYGDITEYRSINQGKFHPSQLNRIPPWVTFEPSSGCPCGLGEGPFGECCLATWIVHAHNDYGPPRSAPSASRTPPTSLKLVPFSPHLPVSEPPGDSNTSGTRAVAEERSLHRTQSAPQLRGSAWAVHAYGDYLGGWRP
jgi:hypothetical protein